ncbi:tetraspanin-2a isoform X2 [Ictalurus furcatus]|uniref:tetraspanin-2a isoform X2 n=1 Tax=Ictalurus furcatus TaxID=66913 RepID=UPI002350A903|nr:tetraspanin-2a isoform X2 [Ictalurus furcatus]
MSKVHGVTKCVKYLLFVFNFIFWLCGSLVLAVGLWLRFDPNTKSLLNADNAPQTFFFAVYILMGVGGIMMLVGFFGCCGAVRESQCLLGLFFSCLLIIFGAEVAAGIFGLLNKDGIINEVKNFYSTSFNTTSGFTKITFVYHNNLECCGDLEGKSNTSLCTTNNTKDCLKAIEDFFNEKLIIIGYVGIGTAGIMIIGMIFSIVLCRGIRSNREVL